MHLVEVTRPLRIQQLCGQSIKGGHEALWVAFQRSQTRQHTDLGGAEVCEQVGSEHLSNLHKRFGSTFKLPHAVCCSLGTGR